LLEGDDDKMSGPTLFFDFELGYDNPFTAGSLHMPFHGSNRSAWLYPESGLPERGGASERS